MASFVVAPPPLGRSSESEVAAAGRSRNGEPATVSITGPHRTIPTVDEPESRSTSACASLTAEANRDSSSPSASIDDDSSSTSTRSQFAVGEVSSSGFMFNVNTATHSKRPAATAPATRIRLARVRVKAAASAMSPPVASRKNPTSRRALPSGKIGRAIASTNNMITRQRTNSSSRFSSASPRRRVASVFARNCIAGHSTTCALRFRCR